jgi:hypothetical protein
LNEIAASPLSASDYLAGPLRVGEPDVCESLAVYPIWSPPPEQAYVSFAQGQEAGATIKELETAASVNDLLVINPTPDPLLLFEGEEVTGAQQDRTFDVTALIAARSQEKIPVSCVEAGRWDGSRHSEAFNPSPQTANVELRRRKAAMVRDSLRAGGPARADQAAVWNEVDTRLNELGANSPTRALSDAYESRRARLEEIGRSITLREGQSGALVAIAGRFVVLDWVSRPEVFASLHPALIQGYAMDAIDVEGSEALTLSDAEAFLDTATATQISERDGIGLGREVRFAESSLIGTGLAAGDELVQLTVHAQDPADDRVGTGRIRRPSRRRR